MNKRNLGLIIALILIVGTIWFVQSQKGPEGDVVDPSDVTVTEGVATSDDEKAKMYPRAKEIVNPSGFLNTDPITVEELVGNKVILVDFWTYSCINCQRTFPYLKEWWREYKDDGLMILGVHTPEFKFEQKRENVERAIERFGIEYPVVMDNDYSTWRAYNNRYWPRKYLIDIDGYIVYDHIGEGAYEETEQKIRDLLEERAQQLGETLDFEEDMTRPEDVDEADFSRIRTPEIYFGALRNSRLGNGEKNTLGIQSLEVPLRLSRDTLYLGGDWFFDGEYAENRSKEARIVLQYSAKKVNIVAGSEEGSTIRVYNDGKLISSGSDVEGGEVSVQEEGLYNVINNDDYGDHTLELIIEDPGAQIFTFTFG